MNDNHGKPPADQHEGHQWIAWLDAARVDEDGWGQPLAEPHDEGGLHLLDLVAAVDYLARGHRDGLTVWDALEEALRWWTTEWELVRHGAPDPDSDDNRAPSAGTLGDTLTRFVTLLAEPDSPPPADALQQAIRLWNTAMAERHNASHHWPHPTPRRSFPPAHTSAGNGA